MKQLLTVLGILGLFILPGCNDDELQSPKAPELISPESGLADAELELTFNWRPAPNAKSYSFQLATVSDFTNTESNLTEIKEVNVTIGNLMPSTKYYWRVNAKNAVGISEWSDTWEFTTEHVGIPLLILPLDNEVLDQNQTTLQWGSISDAGSYSVQVSLSEDFSSIAFNEENLTETELQVVDLACFSTYYWRVRASIGNCNSEWSMVRKFTTQVEDFPMPISPINNSILNDNEVSLQWNSAEGADSYTLQISTTPDFSSSVLIVEDILTTNAVIPDLSWNAKYF